MEDGAVLNVLLLLKSHLKIKNLYQNRLEYSIRHRWEHTIRTILQGIFSKMLNCFGMLRAAVLLLSVPPQGTDKGTSKMFPRAA